MSDRTTTPIGDIVAGDFRAAAVFERFGIDFCCGGRRPLEEACRTASADPAEVQRALDALPSDGAAPDDAAQWPPDRLIDHIVSTHHDYLRTALPTIARYLDKLCGVHGARHPELFRVGEFFGDMRRELELHMMKEEQMLFPYIRLLAAPSDRCGVPPSPFGSVNNPIRAMEREHREAAGELQLIHEATQGYTVPDDGCTTFRVCMAELARLERDLHRHVHLENNVLFPAAIDLETTMCGHDRA